MNTDNESAVLRAVQASVELLGDGSVVNEVGGVLSTAVLSTAVSSGTTIASITTDALSVPHLTEVLNISTAAGDVMDRLDSVVSGLPAPKSLAGSIIEARCIDVENLACEGSTGLPFPLAEDVLVAQRVVNEGIVELQAAANQVAHIWSPYTVWEQYLSALTVNPIRTKCVTGFVMYALSDLLTQVLLRNLLLLRAHRFETPHFPYS
eukprot:6870900-Pyramimonas_sp.AAC.1